MVRGPVARRELQRAIVMDIVVDGSICDKDAEVQRKEFAAREFIRPCFVRVHQSLSGPEDMPGGGVSESQFVSLR